MPDRVVYAGYLVRCPLGGYAWQVLHYLLGLRALGFDAYFWEDTRHVEEAFDPERGVMDLDYGYGCRFAARLFERFGLGDRWVFHDVRRDRFAGQGREAARSLLDEATVLINAGGVHRFDPEARRGKRTIYLDMDPAFTQLRLAAGDARLAELIGEHELHFTYGENIGRPDCPIPSRPFDWRPTRPPVILQEWPAAPPPSDAPFTTIGRWDSGGRDTSLDGELYTWRKRTEWQKVMALPGETGARFLLAMDVHDRGDRDALGAAGWDLVDPIPLSRDVDAYREFIRRSAGEFTTAKDVNVRLRSGWFSDRSACYLASGRPVVTQDTGFDRCLPTGEGLLAFRGLADAAAAVRAVLAEPARHTAAARRIAEEHFAAPRVLHDMLRAL
ncbi:MAG: glycosyltransferase [Thermodesulfobacteriota bacterium]